MAFFLTFILLFSSMHYYIYTKIKAITAINPVMDGIIFCLIVILVLSPLFLETILNKNLIGATGLAYFVYFWIAFVFLFVCSALVLDGLRMVVNWMIIISHHNLYYLYPSDLVEIVLPFVISAFICAYGFFDARNIRLEKIDISSPKITQRIKLLQISDLHLSPVVNKFYLNQILEISKKEKPDIIISTGDLIDAMGDNFDELSVMFNQAVSKYGKYATTGNHEFYRGITKSLAFTRSAGFTILREQAASPVGNIVLVGVDDDVFFNSSRLEQEVETNLLKSADQSKFIVFLKHRPTILKTSLPFFDLQLSGHTHQGQIFPFGLVVHLFFKYWAGGLYEIDGKKLYVNRGAGTWGPPIRFLASPEVTLINLVPETLKP